MYMMQSFPEMSGFSLMLNAWDRINSQYHGCWCSGFLRCQHQQPSRMSWGVSNRDISRVHFTYPMKGAPGSSGPSYYSDLTLLQAFQPMAKKAALPLAKILATASCRSSKTSISANGKAAFKESCALIGLNSWTVYLCNIERQASGSKLLDALVGVDPGREDRRKQIVRGDSDDHRREGLADAIKCSIPQGVLQ